MRQLMLIHGAIGGVDQLIPLRDVLKNNFDVHLLEFEGHGNKASSNTPFSLESFNRQLSDALDEIGEPTHIFGYSMGGFIALLSAASGNANILSITTLGTKMEWSEEIAEKEIKHLNPEVIEEKVPAFARALRKRHGDLWSQVLEKTAGFMKDLGVLKPIQKSNMEKITIPVNLCLAEHDTMVSMGETQQVHRWISDSKLQIIPNSKHPIEQVELIILSDTITSFIQSIDRN